MHFANSGMSGRGEGHRVGIGFCLLCEVVGLVLKSFGDVAGGGDDEAGSHGGFGDKGRVFVGGVHCHFEVFG